MVEGVSGVRLKKEELDCAEQRIREATGWDDRVEEKTGFVAAACQNYEVLVEDKRGEKIGGGGPSQWYETRFGLKPNEAANVGAQERKK